MKIADELMLSELSETRCEIADNFVIQLRDGVFFRFAKFYQDTLSVPIFSTRDVREAQAFHGVIT